MANVPPAPAPAPAVEKLLGPSSFSQQPRHLPFDAWDERLAMWSEDNERPYTWDGITYDARSGPSQHSSSLALRRELRPVCSLHDVSLASNAFSGGIRLDIATCATLASLNLSSKRLPNTLPSNIKSFPNPRVAANYRIYGLGVLSPPI
jgi:hypothetical protein